MCEYSSVDGFANDWHLVHLGSPRRGRRGARVHGGDGGHAGRPDLSRRSRHLEGRAHRDARAHRVRSSWSRARSPASSSRTRGERRAPLRRGRAASRSAASDGGWSRSWRRARFRSPRATRRRVALEIARIQEHRARRSPTRRAARSTPASRWSRFTRRTATCIHEFLSPLSNTRTDDVRRQLRESHHASCARSSRRCAQCGPSACRSSCASPPPIGPTAAGTSRSRRARAHDRAARRRSHRLLVRRQRSGVRDSARARAIRCRSRRACGTNREDRNGSGGADHRARAGGRDRPRRARRTSCCSRAKRCAIRISRSTPPRSSARKFAWPKQYLRAKD